MNSHASAPIIREIILDSPAARRDRALRRVFWFCSIVPSLIERVLVRYQLSLLRLLLLEARSLFYRMALERAERMELCYARIRECIECDAAMRP